jgi:predicted flavoprotein YhiN
MGLRKIMMAGKVDITNTKTYKELHKENKDKELKIHYLTKKYVKAQHRVQYEEKNVIYILTTRRMKKDRVYILGKATNLTSRLSTYNKSDEHEVVLRFG